MVTDVVFLLAGKAPHEIRSFVNKL